MTRRPETAVCAPPCGEPIKPCNCGGSACPGWRHTRAGTAHHWCKPYKGVEGNQPKPADLQRADDR